MPNLGCSPHPPSLSPRFRPSLVFQHLLSSDEVPQTGCFGFAAPQAASTRSHIRRDLASGHSVWITVETLLVTHNSGNPYCLSYRPHTSCLTPQTVSNRLPPTRVATRSNLSPSRTRHHAFCSPKLMADATWIAHVISSDVQTLENLSCHNSTRCPLPLPTDPGLDLAHVWMD